MYLSLIDSPFVPHNLMSTQEGSAPLLKFQMAPILKILTSCGSKEGTEIYFFFSLKNPGKWTLSRFPNRVPMKRDSRLQGICISLENITKIPLNKRALRKMGTSMYPKSGAHKEADAHLRASLNISFWAPVKESSLEVPFMESLAERCPFLQRSIHLSNSPVYESASRFHVRLGWLYCETFNQNYQKALRIVLWNYIKTSVSRNARNIAFPVQIKRCYLHNLSHRNKQH